MDVEFFVRRQEEALALLRSVLPNRTEETLLAALQRAGGVAQTALNQLLEGGCAGGSTASACARGGGRPEAAPVEVEPVEVLSQEVPSPTAAEDGGRPGVGAPPQGPGVAAPQGPLAKLEAILPDCDAAHLAGVLAEVGGDENAALETILSRGAYPKRPPRRGGGPQAASPSSSSAAGAGPGEDGPHLEKLGEDYWFDPAKRRGERRLVGTYVEEARNLLVGEFSELRRPGVVKVFEQCESMYAVAWRRCYDALGEILAGRKPLAPLVALVSPRKRPDLPHPRELKATRLRQEAAFVRRWTQQSENNEEQKRRQEAYHKMCEAKGLLLECECCFADALPERTIQCAAGHLFCADCAKRYVKTLLSGESGLPKLSCPSTSGCAAKIPRSELARVLTPALLASYDESLGKASIEAAILQGGLPNAEKCPFCDFYMVMDLSPEENKIFVCLDERCGKESCRLCKEESHIPLRCHEVEKKTQEQHRLSVEESMSNALIRDCPVCKAKGIATRFVKESECNKMTCPKCKSWVCYVCNQQISKQTSYGHFCQHALDPGKKCTRCKSCPLWDGSGSQKDTAKAEQERVRQAALRADGAFREAHKGEDLKENLEVLEEHLQAATGRILVQGAGTGPVNGAYDRVEGRISGVGGHYYEQVSGPHRIYAFSAYGGWAAGWFIGRRDWHGIYFARGTAESVPTSGWQVYNAPSWSSPGLPPAPRIAQATSAAGGAKRRRVV